jgi:NAD(P)-dependent dehydrogenase (short-subunit alcohol dehydrogenase family)
MLDLNGKVAFVAGAGSVAEGWGNGRATAVLMARQGAKVFGTDYSAEALAGTTAAMEKEGHQQWTPYQADMTRSEAVQNAVDECVRRHGRIDILVNNVGGSAPGTPVSLSVEDWDAQMDRNIKTAFLGCKHVLPVMERQFEADGKGGAIVNVSSIASMSFQVGGRVHVAYAASKAGLEAFSRATAIAYVKKGIRVNTVVVGMMNTPLVAQRLTKQLGISNPKELEAKRNALVPMGRMGEAWDIAHAILFLASDEAGYITATQLVVDGGVTASRMSPAESVAS